MIRIQNDKYKFNRENTFYAKMSEYNVFLQIFLYFKI